MDKKNLEYPSMQQTDCSTVKIENMQLFFDAEYLHSLESTLQE